MAERKSPSRAFVVVDADNTLWDTNAVYANAQLALLSAVEDHVGVSATGDRLAYLRAIDQALAQRHPQRLRYPARLLAQALASALDRGDASNAVLEGVAEAGLLDELIAQAIEKDFIEALRSPPSIRDGVREGLDAFRSDGAVMVILTEGHKARVQANAEALGLAPYFSDIIEAVKTPRSFGDLMERAPSSDLAFVIGDQLQSDIRPAKAAGFTTIYFPGGFRPGWEPEVAEIGPDHQIRSFAEAPPIVRTRTKASLVNS